jgi:RNA polymerase sigma-32 factor
MERRLSAPEVSLDEPMVQTEEGMRCLRRDAFAAPAEERPDIRCENEELAARLRQGITGRGFVMDERERLLLERRWLEDEPTVLQELSTLFGVSRERVRQIERRLLAELRGVLGEEGSAPRKTPRRRRGPAPREMAVAAAG